MCTLRALWIIDPNGEVLFSRRFNSVEKRLQSTPGYKPLPMDQEFSELACVKMKNLSQDTDNSIYFGLPNVWPVVHIHRLGLHLVTVPVAEGTFRTASTMKTPAQELPLVHLPYVTASVVFLDDLSVFVASFGPVYARENLTALHPILCKILPFGKPLDTDFRNTMSVSKFPEKIENSKQPGWRPEQWKGKNPQVDFIISEVIEGHQYDHGPQVPNKLTVHGSVTCRCDVEGTPELTVQLTPKGTNPITVNQISYHPNTQVSPDNFKKMVLSPPPVGEFVLCKYMIAAGKRMPLRGFYQMKENSPTEVKILLQIKLDKLFVNDFEYCRVIVPFPNRGLIDSSKDAPSAGSVSIRDDLKALVWEIGTKFTGPNQEVALPSTITFVDEETPSEAPPQADPMFQQQDPFLTGLNSYVKIEFKMKGASHLEILSKNVSIVPKGQIIFTQQTFSVAGEYYVWNSFGKARYAIDPQDMKK